MSNIVNKKLSDRIGTVDVLKEQFSAPKEKRHTTFHTEISATDEFGNVLFSNEHNETVLGGAITVMEKMWGIRSPLQLTPTWVLTLIH